MQGYRMAILACVLLYGCRGGHARPLLQSRPATESPAHWVQMARQDLKEAADVFSRVNNRRAKNAILFLGDGMGVTSVTAGRILKGQLDGKSGEEARLEFERFPHTGLAKTYNTDMQTPDSAGTATAFLCGVKARSGTMGVNELVGTRNCTSQLKAHNVFSYLNEAQELGKSVGIVTTTRITHATPGAAYSHTSWRDWEDDTERNRDVLNESDRVNCPDIAEQMMENAINYTVLFGGGRLKFLPRSVSTIDPVTGNSVNGTRSDSVNLVERWNQRQSAFGRTSKYLETRKDLQDLAINADTYLGLFATNHLRYDLDNQPDQKEPTLEEMTRKAIEILKRNPNGFALLVEGGRIDHGHHDNLAKKALYDLVAFDKAIKAAGEMTSADDTLSVVTADHSHVFSFGGYSKRGQPVFGKVQYSSDGRYNSKGDALALDNLPYTSLYYGDGRSAEANRTRANITDVDTEAANYLPQAVVPMAYESHGAEDVPVYAKGPGAHLFHTTHEQSYVAHVIKHSMCVGPYAVEGYCLGAGMAWPSVPLMLLLLLIRAMAD